jgi:hypothetical protein
MEIAIAAFGISDFWMYTSSQDMAMEGMFVPVTVMSLEPCDCQVVGVFCNLMATSWAVVSGSSFR